MSPVLPGRLHWKSSKKAFRYTALGAVLACAALAAPAAAQDVHWTGAVSDTWSNPGNWWPAGPPVDGSHAHIGSLPNVENSWVYLNINQILSDLTITDGMVLRTYDNILFVQGGDTVISGRNETAGGVIHPSSIVVDYRAGGATMSTRGLSLNDGAWLRLRDGGHLRVWGAFSIADDSLLHGEGRISFHGQGDTFVNHGAIQASTGAGIWLEQLEGGRFDLDGNGSDAIIYISGYNIDDDHGTRFRLDGPALADTFSGELWLGADADLFMNLDDGWTADAYSLIRVFPSQFSDNPAVIRGGDVDLAGEVRLYSRARLRIDTNTTISETAIVGANDEAQLEFAGATAVLGGSHSIGRDANLIFSGETSVQGGIFKTATEAFGIGFSSGLVSFDGPTEWDGQVLFSGAVSQNGDASVSGGVGAVIEAALFDMDGEFGSTTWDISANLLMNVDRIGPPSTDRFDGTINIAGGFTPRLILNLSNQSAAWTMGGTMNLHGFTHLFETRVSGSPMVVEGNLNVTGNKVAIASDTSFDGAIVEIADSGTTLRMEGLTTVGQNVVFAGQGILRNGQTGAMTLLNGANLGTLGLINDGILEVDAKAGVALVDRFENTANGVVVVSLGGYAQGSEYDMLATTNGPALLDGTLEIEMIDLGAGLFEPSVGDQFVILEANAGVIGAFANDPVSIVEGRTYTWSVLYTPGSVVLYLKSIED